jgi:hypothetical protein
MVAGHCFDYEYDGKDAALTVAEQLVKMHPHQRMGGAAGFYSKFRDNILYACTNASQWGASAVIA